MPNLEFFCNICGEKFFRYWSNSLEKTHPGGPKRCNLHKTPTIRIAWKHKNVRHDTFNSPISDEAAYWVGFLLADGSLSYRRDGAHLLSLWLASKDSDQVVNFVRFIGADEDSIRTKPNNGWGQKGEVTGIMIVAHKLGARLTELGFTPKKSYDATVPPELSFNADFWRGQLDGDGAIGIRGHDWRHPLVQTCGTRAVVYAFTEYVDNVTGFRPNIVSSSSCTTTFQCAVHHKNALKLIKTVWGRKGPSLERKRLIAEKILAVAEVAI